MGIFEPDVIYAGTAILKTMDPLFIIRAISCAFANYWLSKTDDKAVFYITVAMVISFFVTMIPIRHVILQRWVPLILNSAILIAVLLYGILSKDLSGRQRLLYMLIVIPLWAYIILVILNLPGAGFIKFIQFIPVAAYIACLFSKPPPNATGFLTILAGNALWMLIGFFKAVG
jgi:lysylphosphatidylglycerol synthetase-like protein (DUF2156 family)